jgi:hypothetical protein
MASGTGSAFAGPAVVGSTVAGPEVTEGPVVDPEHPDTMTMMIAATNDRFDAERVVVMSGLILSLGGSAKAAPPSHEQDAGRVGSV